MNSDRRGEPTPVAIDEAIATFQIHIDSGVQIFSASALLEFHHPPLQTTLPTLVSRVDSQGAELAHTLSRFYPANLQVQTLVSGEPIPLAHTLAQLTTQRKACDWWFVPARSMDSSLPHLADLIAQLRAPDGCPWDRAQTHQSLRPYLLEEAHELLEALDSGDPEAVCDELGDVLLQILLHSQLGAENGAFTILDVLEQLARKLIRRHPHVWGEAKLDSPDAVRQTWEQLKREERGETETSRPTLAGLPKSLPALLQAQRYQERAAKVGFDWDDASDVAAKVHEELEELLRATPGAEREAEFGDLLFALVNWARWLEIPDVESALRATNQRFYLRFQFIENRLREAGSEFNETTLAEMDALWDEAKRLGL